MKFGLPRCFFLLLGALSLSLLAACSSEPEAAKKPAVRTDGERVLLAEPDKAGFLQIATVDRDQGEILTLPGRIVWDEERTVRVVPQVAGRIQRVAVAVGQAVKAGETLAWLSSPDYGQARAELRKAEAAYRLAQQNLVRQRELREAGVIAEKDWQQSEAEAAAARAERERAQRQLASLGGEADSYPLKAPLAGIVVERNLNPGMEFRPEAGALPLFVITDPARLWLQLDAGEADLAALKPGEELSLEVKAYPGERFAGVIRHVADFVDPATRTLRVRGEVANPDRRLKAEMFVRASIRLPAGQALSVPSGAVFLQGERRYVFVEEAAGIYRRQAVSVGRERNGRLEILGGLEAGVRVVSEGNLHLLKYFKPVTAGAQ
ncbi:efflux RND transporter periplasmic adaptor subunit [Dechloromonas sp. ZY10]|uniref:efflux RND transporter periplasmic adaptor subunit n=1 Tax=Dechloromonas aquae TaxID=2664436 RepID=UPI0035275D08